MKVARGTPTDLNLFTLSHLFRGLDVVRNRIDATSMSGVRRCAKFGLLTATRDFLTLTNLGRDALCGWAFDRGGWGGGFRADSFLFKRCSCCGADFNRGQWEALRLIGRQSQYTDSGHVDVTCHLELRNCSCDSTLSVEMPS